MPRRSAIWKSRSFAKCSSSDSRADRISSRRDRRRNRSRSRRSKRRISSSKAMRTSRRCSGRCSSRSRKSCSGCTGLAAKGCMSAGKAAVVFFVLVSTFCVLPVQANELNVDKRMMQLDDTVTITVTLDDAFASIDSIRMPLQNLAIDGAPSVSSEFDFINGVTSRRKTFRYIAHALAPGGAMVGPITLHGAGGQVETLAPVAIQILPDATAGSNDPAKILHELMATNHDPI